MNLSIILPIYNEEKVIEKSILKIISSVKKEFNKFEILAVNDGSTDKTIGLLKKLSAKDKRIKLVFHSTNRGYGAALRSGIKNAKYELIFFTDSDMQFNIEELKKFLPYVDKFDYIVGYRNNRADSVRRKFISYVYNKFVKIMFNLPIRDVDCAFKLMKKSSLEKIVFFSNSFFVSAEVIVKSCKKGFKIKEIGVSHYPRLNGASTVTYKKIFLTLIDLLKLYKSVYL